MNTSVSSMVGQCTTFVPLYISDACRELWIELCSAAKLLVQDLQSKIKLGLIITNKSKKYWPFPCLHCTLVSTWRDRGSRLLVKKRYITFIVIIRYFL